MLRTTNRRVYADRRRARRPAVHPCRQLPCRPGDPRDAVPAAGARTAALIPWATYTDPELAHVGLTEAAGREALPRACASCAGPMPRTTAPRPSARRTATSSCVDQPQGRDPGRQHRRRRRLRDDRHAGRWRMAQRLEPAATSLDLVRPIRRMGEIGKRAAITYFALRPAGRWCAPSSASCACSAEQATVQIQGRHPGMSDPETVPAEPPARPAARARCAAGARPVDQAAAADHPLRAARRSADLPAVDRQFPPALAGGAAGHGGGRVDRAARRATRTACRGRCRTTC